jgi:hypothetical protein
MSSGGGGGVPALLVVVAEAAALRLPAGKHGGHSTHSVASFGHDMPAAVPLARWDWERCAASSSGSSGGGNGGSGGSGMPARFGGFLDGGWVAWLGWLAGWVCLNVCCCCCAFSSFSVAWAPL